MRDAIIEVLKIWGKPNGDFDAMWHGYDIMIDELKEKGHTVKLSSLKKEMKKMRDEGMVELRPTYDDEYKLYGRGWFLIDP